MTDGTTKTRQASPAISARAAAIGVALLLCACKSDYEQPAANRDGPAVKVIAHEIFYRPEILRIESVGTARARTFTMIQPETGGEVVAVFFETNTYVESGAPLIKLEARQEELAVRLAEVALRDAEQLLARYRRIEDTGAVSDSQIDGGQTAVDAARLSLEQAKNALDERTITAPFAGHVGLSDIDVGARVTPTTEITQLDDRSSLYVDFAVPEQALGRMAVGEEITVIPFADDDKQIQARIVGMDSRIDPVQRTLIVRAEIDNFSDALRPGMSFRVVFQIAGDAYAAVPEAAILWGGGGAYVWAINAGEAARKPVVIMAREEGFVLVRGDLPKNSQIVLEGTQKVRDGTAVMILNSSGEEKLPAHSVSAGAGSGQ